MVVMVMVAAMIELLLLVDPVPQGLLGHCDSCCDNVVLCLISHRRQARDSEGFNCLHHAAASGQVAVVKVLLRSMPPDVRGSEVRTPVDNGRTAGLLARELAKKGGHSLVDHMLTAAGTEPAFLTRDEEDAWRKQVSSLAPSPSNVCKDTFPFAVTCRLTVFIIGTWPSSVNARLLIMTAMQ